MQKLISPFIALLVSIWLINLGGGLQGTLLGMRADMEAFDLSATGMIMSSYFLGYMVSFFVSPSFINGVGHIRSFAAFASISSAATLLHAVFVDPIVWFFLRTLTGLCYGGLILVGESWLNASSGNENRGAIFSTYMLVILSATALSQTLVNLTPVGGYDLFVLVSVALSVSLVPLTLSKKIIAPEIQETARMAFGESIKRFPLGVLGVIVSGLVSGALWTMMAVYAIRIGMDTGDVSKTMFCMMVGGMLSLWPVGKISDRIDRRKIILLLGISSLLAAALFVVPTIQSFALIPLYATFLGVTAFPLYAVSSSHINDYLEDHEFVPVCGTLVLFYGLGAMLAPLISAWSMQYAGPQGMFWFLMVIEVPLIIFASLRIIKKDVLPVEERTDFVADLPKVTPVVSPLDPRNQEAEEMSEEIQRQQEEEEALL